MNLYHTMSDDKVNISFDTNRNSECWCMFRTWYMIHQSIWYIKERRDTQQERTAYKKITLQLNLAIYLHNIIHVLHFHNTRAYKKRQKTMIHRQLLTYVRQCLLYYLTKNKKFSEVFVVRISMIHLSYDYIYHNTLSIYTISNWSTLPIQRSLRKEMYH